MTKIIRIGMDTSKSVFVLHGVDATEQPVLRRKLRRKQVLEFFAKLEPTKVGLEACGAAHYWARELRALGHEVVVVPPQYVKPYVKRNKNDAADAEAICEAMSRPTMRFVPVKTAEQQAALMLAGTRNALVRRRTQLTNTIRGYAAEFGLTAAKGLDKIEPLLARIAEAALPKLAKELFATHARGWPDRGFAGGHEGPRSSRVPLRPQLFGLARSDAEGSLDRRQDAARRDHPRRRRGFAQRVGGRRHRRDPEGEARKRATLALAGRASQAQAAQARGHRAGQQECPHHLEADGQRGTLQSSARRGGQGRGDGGPVLHKRDTVLAAVKDAARRRRRWPKRAILDRGCARCHWATAGRDGETALRSNKETDLKEARERRSSRCLAVNSTPRSRQLMCYQNLTT